MLRLTVSDTGHGIAPEDTHKVFVAFERLDAIATDIEGHGLGMAISKRFIELMGGAIGVESVVGEGSAFWIELPIAAGPDEQVGRSSSLAEVEQAITTKPCTLLYIEDNLANLKLVERILARRPGIMMLAAMQANSASNSRASAAGFDSAGFAAAGYQRRQSARTTAG